MSIKIHARDEVSVHGLAAKIHKLLMALRIFVLEIRK